MAQSRTKKLGFPAPRKGGLGKVTVPKGPGTLSDAGKLGGIQGGLAKDGNQPFGHAVASLAAAIRVLQTEDGSESVRARVEIGQRLADVRKRLPHGDWLKFLSQEVGYGFRTGQRLIQLGRWAPHNQRVLARVEGWGPTKVLQVMDAGPELAKRLLSRKRYPVPGTAKSKSLELLTIAELKEVLTLMGAGKEPEATAPDEVADTLRALKRASQKVMRLANELKRLTEAETLEQEQREEVAKVRRRLLRSAKRLEETIDKSG